MSKNKLAGIIAAVIVTIIVVAVVVAPDPDSEEIDTPGARAEFVFSELIVSPAEVEPGDTVTVTVDVQNVGGEQGTHLLELAVDGLVEQSEGVTLDAGETTSMSFSIQRETVSSYSVELGGLQGVFLVIEPASAPPNAAESTHITIGSHKDDVSRIQGEPDGVDTIGPLEMWYYNDGNVYFDRKSGIVTGWHNNTGYLQARVSVGDKNVTSATHITIGSHKDDVYRVQGEPDGVDTIGSLEMWYYYDGHIYFDGRTSRVTGWQNTTGHLKVTTA